jgi:hypothetical protein
MKTIKLTFLSLTALVLFAAKTQAQTTPPPPPPAPPTATTASPAPAPATTTSYAGKWDILAKGLPNGDTHIFFTITNTDGKLGGTMTDMETKKENPLTKVEQDDKGVTLYFTAQGYDVTLTLAKTTDDDHVKGSMMGMFDCTGERVK